MRHITRTERDALRAMVDACGHTEILTILASMVAHDHPDGNRGSDLRIRLNKIGVVIGREMDPKPART